MTDPPERLSASQISLILQRAAEIDARGDTLSVEELRRIAAEAGIDPGATSVAIQEILAEERLVPEPSAPPLPAPQTAPPRLSVTKRVPPSPWRVAAGGAVGAALGFVLASSGWGLMLPLITPLPALGSMAVYLLLRAIQAMKRGAQLDFQLQNFTIWWMALISAGTVESATTSEIFSTMMILWIVTSVSGGLLVHFGPRDPEWEDDASDAPPPPHP